MTGRWISSVLLLVFAASVIGWIVYVPPQVMNLHQPVPAHAQLIYSSAKPDWFVAFFPMLGKLDGEFSNAWKEKFQWLEKRPLAVARAALPGGGGRDSWVAVSAVGSRMAVLRWQLTLAPPSSVRALRPYHAWPIWQLDEPALPSWVRIRFALAEGLLICSVSDDAHDIYWLLDALDGHRHSLADRKGSR